MDPSEWEQVGSVRDSDNNGVMVSNLPLLFANSEPTSLQNMTQRQLERFVGFMVHCSVGEELTKPWNRMPKPPWWPNRLPFKVLAGATPTPSQRSMLQRLVERCYQYHGCEFLLEFCRLLVQQRPLAGYRFTDNRDGTTSMHHSSSGKLLVTFRNENREYDKLTPGGGISLFKPAAMTSSHSSSSRPQLLPRRSSSSASIMVRQEEVTDVYLCDRCDMEFTALHDVQAHERECSGSSGRSAALPGGCTDPLLLRSASPEPELVEMTDQVARMHLLGLVPAQHTGLLPYSSPCKKGGGGAGGGDHLSNLGSKRGGLGGATAGVRGISQGGVRKLSRSNYFRYESVDVSSPLGRMLRYGAAGGGISGGILGIWGSGAGGRGGGSSAGGLGAPSQQLVLRYERHLAAAPDVVFPHMRDTSRGLTRWVIVFRNPKLPWYHSYNFTKGQRCERWLTIETGIDCRARTLFKLCRPCKVVVRRVPKRTIDRYTWLGDRRKCAPCIDLTCEEGSGNSATRGLLKSAHRNGSQGRLAVQGGGSTPAPLTQILDMVRGTCNWTLCPGFLQHVIAGGAVPDNPVAVSFQKLFSPKGLLVCLLSESIRSKNLPERAMQDYGTLQPSAEQQNALLNKYGILSDVAEKLVYSNLMMDLVSNYGHILYDPSEMVRLTTLPPTITRVTDPEVNSVFASLAARNYQKPQQPQAGGSLLSSQCGAPTPSTSALQPVFRQKPGPKCKRKPLPLLQQQQQQMRLLQQPWAKARGSNSAPWNISKSGSFLVPSGSQVTPVQRPTSTFTVNSASKQTRPALSQQQHSSQMKMEELKLLASRNFSSEQLTNKIKTIIQQKFDETSSFGTLQWEKSSQLPVMKKEHRGVLGGGFLDPVDDLHLSTVGIDENGIPVIDVIDLSSDEEVERSSPRKQQHLTTNSNSKTLSGTSSGSSGSSSGSSGSYVDVTTGRSLNKSCGAQDGVVYSDGGRGGGSSGSNSSAPRVRAANSSQTGTAYAGSVNCHDTASLNSKTYSSSKAMAGSLKLPSSPSVANSAAHNNKCQSSPMSLSSKNERSHWSHSPPDVIHVTNGGLERSFVHGTCSSDWSRAGVRCGGSDGEDGDNKREYVVLNESSVGVINNNNNSARISSNGIVSNNTANKNINGFSNGGCYFGDVVTEEEERYNPVVVAASAYASSTDIVTAHIKTSLVPVVVPPLLKNNNYLTRSSVYTVYAALNPTYDWDSSKVTSKRRGAKRILSGYDSEYELESIFKLSNGKRLCGEEDINSNTSCVSCYNSTNGSTFSKSSDILKRSASVITSGSNNWDMDELELNCKYIDLDDSASDIDNKKANDSRVSVNSFVVDDEVSFKLPVYVGEDLGRPASSVRQRAPTIQSSAEQLVTFEDYFEGRDVYEVPSDFSSQSESVSNVDYFEGMEVYEVPSCHSNLQTETTSNVSWNSNGGSNSDSLASDCHTDRVSGIDEDMVYVDESSNSKGNSGARSLLSSVLNRGLNFLKNIGLSTALKSPEERSDCNPDSVADTCDEEVTAITSSVVGTSESCDYSTCSSSASSIDDDSEEEGEEESAAGTRRRARMNMMNVPKEVSCSLMDECKELSGVHQLVRATINSDKRITRCSVREHFPATRMTSPRGVQGSTCLAAKYDQGKNAFKRERRLMHRNDKKMMSKRRQKERYRLASDILRIKFAAKEKVVKRMKRKRRHLIHDGVRRDCRKACENECRNKCLKCSQSEKNKGEKVNTEPLRNIPKLKAAENCSLASELADCLAQSLLDNLTGGVLGEAIVAGVGVNCFRMLSSHGPACVQNPITGSEAGGRGVTGSEQDRMASSINSGQAFASKVRQSSSSVTKVPRYQDNRKNPPKSPSIMDSILKKRSSKSPQREDSLQITDEILPWLSDSSWLGARGFYDTACESPISSSIHADRGTHIETGETSIVNHGSTNPGNAIDDPIYENNRLQQGSILGDEESTSDLSNDTEITIKGAVEPRRKAGKPQNITLDQWRSRNSSSSSSDEETVLDCLSTSSRQRRDGSLSSHSRDNIPLRSRLVSRLRGHRPLRKNSSPFAGYATKRLKWTESKYGTRNCPSFKTKQKCQEHKLGGKSGRMKQSRMVKRLLEDECKGFTEGGFHPRQVLSSYFTKRMNRTRDVGFTLPVKESKHNKTTMKNDLEGLAMDELKELKKLSFHPKDIVRKLSNVRNVALYEKTASKSSSTESTPHDAFPPIAMSDEMNNCVVAGKNVCTNNTPAPVRALGISSSGVRNVAVKRTMRRRPQGWTSLQGHASNRRKECDPRAGSGGFVPLQREPFQEESKGSGEHNRRVRVYDTDCDTDDEDSDMEVTVKKKKKKMKTSDRVSSYEDSFNDDGEAYVLCSVKEKGDGKKNNSNRKKIPRELANLAKDECKELQPYGFHPGDIVHYFKTSSEASDNDVPASSAIVKSDAKSAVGSRVVAAKNLDAESESEAAPSRRGAWKKTMAREMKNLFVDEFKEFKRNRPLSRKFVRPSKYRFSGVDASSRSARRSAASVRPFLSGVGSLGTATCFNQTLQGKRSCQSSVSEYGGCARPLLTAMKAHHRSRAQRTLREAHDKEQPMTMTPRHLQMSMIQSEGAMCVINYKLPDIS